MAKVKVVNYTEGYSYFRAFRDPDGDGWIASIDGTDLWIGDESIDRTIKFLNKLKKASK